LLVAGGVYYAIVQRRRVAGTLPEHRPEPLGERPSLTTAGPAIEGHWLGRLAPNE
jgi:hypothetical protein